MSDIPPVGATAEIAATESNASSGPAPQGSKQPGAPSAPPGASKPSAAPATADQAQTAPELAPAAEDPRFAAKFAALSKREKAIREREQKAAAYEEAVKKAKEDPAAYLQAGGLTFSELVDLLTKSEDDKQNPNKQVELLKKEIEAEKQARLQAEEKKKEQQFNQLISEHLDKINKFVDDNADTYELVKANDAQADIFELQDLVFQQSNKLLTIQEASDMVENYLFEQEKQRLQKLSKVKKLASLSQPEAKPVSTGKAPGKAISDTSDSKPVSSKATLTQDYSSSSVPTEERAHLSIEESKSRAKAKLKQLLKP